MIPSEYRLEHVVVGLVERLDGARRSFDDADAARRGFERIADEQVEAAIAEWTELGFTDHPEVHAEFLRREVRETFLPRFLKVALRVNAAEAERYGLGWWGTPAARLVLALVPLLALTVEMRMMVPIGWPIVLASLSLPFLPDIASGLQMRAYRAELEEIVADMGRIQEQQLAWVSAREPQAALSSAPTRRASPSPQRESH